MGLRNIDSEVEAVPPVEAVSSPRNGGGSFFSIGVVQYEIKSDRGGTGKMQLLPWNRDSCRVISSRIMNAIPEPAEIPVPAAGKLFRKTVRGFRCEEQSEHMRRVRVPIKMFCGMGVEEQFDAVAFPRRFRRTVSSFAVPDINRNGQRLLVGFDLETAAFVQSYSFPVPERFDG